MARPELLGTVAVREEAASAPQHVHGGAVAPNPLRHLLDDFVPEGVGVDEHEAGLLLGEGGDELGGAAEADEGAVGVDDGHAIAGSVGELLEVVGGDTAAQMGVGAEQLLYDYGVESHGVC